MSRVFFLLFFLASLCLSASTLLAAAPPPTPRPTRLPTPLPGGNMLPVWMTPPAPGSTQADAGAVLYYERCMACHGDKGQGLTVEWRAQWDVEHQNCARSTCHGARHPPEGFAFPKNFAPALVGQTALTRFENAQALFDYISARMPYQAPGTLTRAEYWTLVAYVLRQRGVEIENVNAANASRIALQPARENGAAVLSIAFVVGGIVSCVGAVIYFLSRRARY